MDEKLPERIIYRHHRKLIYHNFASAWLPGAAPERSDMKKELLELKRTLTIDRYNITKITGYIVDSDRNCRVDFVKNFLNLEETEIFKYLDIFKKVLSGKPGRNMFQLNFEENTRKQHLTTITKTGLEDNDVRQIFLEEIAESVNVSNKAYTMILIAAESTTFLESPQMEQI